MAQKKQAKSIQINMIKWPKIDCPMEKYCPYKSTEECLRCYDSSKYVELAKQGIITA